MRSARGIVTAPSVTAVPCDTDALLGGHVARSFLARYWQKDALLVRGALPGFAGLFTERDLFALAQRDDVESRLIVRSGRRWTFEHGPFRRVALARLPARGWTLLIQGVNLHSTAADALLRRFAFLPYARLDDLMVSLAAPGGGVGPHFDSYDVFLIQGPGRRRWRYGRQDDLRLKPGLPVKILQRFAPSHDAILGPGDMLYLPPQFAHDGVAVDRCTTYSIGFRAASATELATAFLDFLRDRQDIPGRYADPDLKLSGEPARIDAAMRRKCGVMLREIRWNTDTIGEFLGCWLTEPKPAVWFEPPARPRSRSAFLAAAERNGVRLDTRSQLLYDDGQLYLNGDAIAWPPNGKRLLERLANSRALAARDVRTAAASAASMLYDWYRHGFVHTDTR
jgi:50S ribosomal protein L16 3-hydroxylase